MNNIACDNDKIMDFYLEKNSSYLNDQYVILQKLNIVCLAFIASAALLGYVKTGDDNTFSVLGINVVRDDAIVIFFVLGMLVRLYFSIHLIGLLFTSHKLVFIFKKRFDANINLDYMSPPVYFKTIEWIGQLGLFGKILSLFLKYMPEIAIFFASLNTFDVIFDNGVDSERASFHRFLLVCSYVLLGLTQVIIYYCTRSSDQCVAKIVALFGPKD